MSKCFQLTACKSLANNKDGYLANDCGVGCSSSGFLVDRSESPLKSKQASGMPFVESVANESKHVQQLRARCVCILLLIQI